MKKSIFLVLLINCVFIFAPYLAVTAASGEDRIIFLQATDSGQVLYISMPDGSGRQPIAKDPTITAFIGKKHLLYYGGHKLYEYDPLLQQSKLLAEFTEDEISLEFLPGEAGNPDQALVCASAWPDQDADWYILEFSDGSIRRIAPPPGEGVPQQTKNTVAAVIYQPSLSYRYNLEIQEKSGFGHKIIWSLPKDMTVIPERPVWSPDFHRLAFYGKKYNDSLEGFYGLYLLDLETKKFRLIQENVFSKFVYNRLEMGDFTPGWSSDGRYLICQYQPFIMPDQSSILKYDASTGKKYFLNSGGGDKQYPTWSPSNKYIAYFSGREGAYRLHVTGANGENPKIISPAEGYTIWAEWIDTSLYPNGP